MKREYAADTLKWNLPELLTKEKDRATLDFLCECVDFLLKQPQPDPETGLVPCGCGGVAEQMDFHDGFFYHSKVECPDCGIEIMRAGYTTEEAHDMTKEAWNTAMGLKGVGNDKG